MAKIPNYYKIHTDGHEVALEPIYEELVPVVRGRWENGVCVSCKFDLRWLTDGENDLERWVWDEGFYYCPNCGAKMDLECR